MGTLNRIERKLAVGLLLASMSGCAATGAIVASPVVRLTGVESREVSFDRQTFLMSFDISNPNPFPLPVRSLRYSVRLGEHRFASGETTGSITVPARGDSAFAISVELDVLQQMPQLASLLKTGLREDVEYRLEGSLDVDIPHVRPVPFSDSGTISVHGRL
ncbi:MAG: LEA type 2 family protein [Woeseiaceae bacterium]